MNGRQTIAVLDVTYFYKHTVRSHSYNFFFVCDGGRAIFLGSITLPVIDDLVVLVLEESFFWCWLCAEIACVLIALMDATGG